jgi:hypothetical protein
LRLLIAALFATLGLTAASLASAAPFTVVNNSLISYRIDGVDNPTLNLVRGTTYTFNITASGHPFYIKTVQGAGTLNQYGTGVIGNGTQVGTLTWTVADNAPATLFYDCSIHSNMTGQINITTAVPGMNPLSGGLLVLLLAGAGLAFARRRTLLAWIALIR